MKDLQQKLLATFQIEHREHVEHIRSLLALMAHTGSAAGGSEFEEIFRRAHSLKGAARAVDVQPVEQLAHRLETLFSRVRQGACAFDAEVERVTQQVLDATEDCMATLGGEAPAETVAAALRAIGGVLGIEDPITPVSVKAPTSSPTFQPIETLRVSAGNFDGLLQTAGSLTAEITRQDQIGRELAGLAANISRMEKASTEATRAAVAFKLREGPAALSGLDAVLNSLEAMEHEARSIARQARAAHRGHRRAQWSLGQLGRRLQSDIRQARMAPAENLLDGYRRMMRDLARDEGREIRFDASSASVHADRRVLDALKDPIMHLLRNAVSHGIEPAAARTKKGKSPEGLVTLRIDADGQRLIVRVEDDGGGVDYSRVVEIAGSGDSHQNGELTRMLFRPGFTTATAVTSLAGRGMGLSVVDETVRRLQGEVSLDGRPGGGTRITLAVPLSIASHRLIVVRCGTHVFAIPVPGIERLRKLASADVESVGGRPMLTLDGQTIPLASLEELVDPGSQDAPERYALILRSGSQRVAVAVGEILHEADAAVQDLACAGGGAGLISSGAVLYDGTIALVVNPAELVRNALQARARPRPESRPVADKPAAAPPPTILVVDDSMTTRALEKSILEAHGYRVRIAVDGIEALVRLREEAPDLVISDIEMPRLDGFGLIEAMKQDPALEKIPVIVVSSVERREDRERGLATGADAYIVKRRFDQEELLGVIRQIL
ncbi:MAG TPA: response regulator [Bryobacteraceae bacterium]|nr:response regulator [Bryobacteraceae bacterium]